VHGADEWPRGTDGANDRDPRISVLSYAGPLRPRRKRRSAIRATRGSSRHATPASPAIRRTLLRVLREKRLRPFVDVTACLQFANSLGAAGPTPRARLVRRCNHAWGRRVRGCRIGGPRLTSDSMAAASVRRPSAWRPYAAKDVRCSDQTGYIEEMLNGVSARLRSMSKQSLRPQRRLR